MVKFTKKKMPLKTGVKVLDDSLKLVEKYVDKELYEGETKGFFGPMYDWYFRLHDLPAKDLRNVDDDDDENPLKDLQAMPFFALQYSYGMFAAYIGRGRGFSTALFSSKDMSTTFGGRDDDDDRRARVFIGPTGHYCEYSVMAKHESVIAMLTILYYHGIPEARDALRAVVFDALNRRFDMQVGSVELEGEDEVVERVLNTLNANDPRLINRHILLHGPPGCGKSEIVKQVIKQTPDWIHFKLENNVHDWEDFMKALDKVMSFTGSKVMIVADEIDEIGLTREKDQNKVFELLRVLDGVGDIGNTKFIATTNRMADLDEALLRVGRFGPAIAVAAPDKSKVAKIVGFYAKRYDAEDKVDVKYLSDQFVGKSGATIRASFEDCIIQKVDINNTNILRNLELITRK